MKKLYLVKREVWANDLIEASTRRGVIYEISEADTRLQPDVPRKKSGFHAKRK